MKIRLVLTDPDAEALLSSMEARDYYVMGTYTKASEEIALVSIHSNDWAAWIEQHQPKWIIK